MSGFDPEFRRVVDWVDSHRESSDEALPWNDARSVESANWMRTFLQRAEELPLVEPPAIVRQKLRQAFAEHHSPRPATEPPVYVPEVLFDTRTDRELAGVRGSADLAEHPRFQIVLRASVGTVFLEVERNSEGRRDLSGQVVLTVFGPPVFEAIVSTGESVVRSVRGTGHGEFRVEDVSDEARTLVLDNGVFRLEIDLQRTDNS